MRHIKSPQRWQAADGEVSVFLAGSIEQGRAENWQNVVASALAETDLLIINPRRENWDPNSASVDEDMTLRSQIQWELDSIESADIVAFYFSPGTMSPVSLLELGLVCQRKRTIVCCPTGFWRKTNIDMVCRRYLVEQVDDLQNLVMAIRGVCPTQSHS
jgi:hypothetical protein